MESKKESKKNRNAYITRLNLPLTNSPRLHNMKVIRRYKPVNADKSAFTGFPYLL